MRHTALLFPLALACSSSSSSSSSTADTQSAGDTATTGDAAAAEEGPEVDACEHGTEGPFAELTAAADAASGPEANVPHTANTVTLVSGAPGYLTFTVSEEGEYAIALGADVPAALQDASGQPVAFEADEAVTACDAIKKLHVADLGIGTYRLALGPADVPQVLLVAVHVGDHEHEE